MLDALKGVKARPLATTAQANSSSYIDGDVAATLNKCMQTAALRMLQYRHQHQGGNRKMRICAVSWRRSGTSGASSHCLLNITCDNIHKTTKQQQSQ